MFDFIAEIISVVIRPIYSIVQNYGWTIIIFTVLIKLVTMPFQVKSQKSMARMQQVQPLIAEVQRKYANNKEKQQQEISKIYEKYKVSATGGCLPMIFQLIILMGFIQIVYRPVTFILQVPKDVIQTAAESLGLEATTFVSQQFNIFNGENSALMEAIRNAGYPQLTEDALNFNFLGIDLTKILKGNWTDWKCWILPVVALGLTILSTVISQQQAKSKQNPAAKDDAQAAQTQAMSKSMYIMMPLMTIWITVTWPLGAALYWIISTLTQILQQLFIQQVVINRMEPIDISKKSDKKKSTKSCVPKTGKAADIAADFANDNSKPVKNVPGVKIQSGKKTGKAADIAADFEDDAE